MNKRPIDRTKKSNIKCEHCKHWTGVSTECWCEAMYACMNKESNRYKQATYYYNRCKQFEWPEVNNEDQEDNIT